MRVRMKACLIIGFQPFEQSCRIKIKSQFFTTLSCLLLVILERGAILQFERSSLVRPSLDFLFGFPVAVVLKPSGYVLVGLGCGHGVFELRFIDALKTEQLVVQGAVIMVFAELTSNARAALVRGPANDGETSETVAGTVRHFLSPPTPGMDHSPIGIIIACLYSHFGSPNGA